MKRLLLAAAGVLVVLAAAFYLFSDPDIPRAQLETKYAVAPSQFMILPDGARVHYRDRGPKTGPAIILVHGSNASLFTWEPWAKRLSDSFRVISLDLPGHGLTGAVPSGDYSEEGMVRFLKEFADKLALQKFALAGNSMGGAVAAHFAEEYPGRVTHLVLVDAGGLPFKAGDREPIAFQIARIPVLRNVMLYITPRSIVTEGLGDAIVRKEIINDRMIDEYWDFARMAGTRQATLDRFSLPWGPYVKDHIAAIRVPTLILWGEQDHLIPVETGHAYAAAIPGSKLIVYPGVGHIPQEEVADRSAADVRGFLQSPQ